MARPATATAEQAKTARVLHARIKKMPVEDAAAVRDDVRTAYYEGRVTSRQRNQLLDKFAYICIYRHKIHSVTFQPLPEDPG